jgi:hypothetical protein
MVYNKRIQKKGGKKPWSIHKRLMLKQRASRQANLRVRRSQSRRIDPMLCVGLGSVGESCMEKKA